MMSEGTATNRHSIAPEKQRATSDGKAAGSATLLAWSLLLTVASLALWDRSFLIPSLMLLVIPFSAVAIIYGIAAFLLMRKSGGRWMGKVMAMTVIIFAVSPFLLPLAGMAREKAREIQCKRNVTEIGVQCERYQQEHGGQVPQSIDDLQVYPEMERLVICPLAKDRNHPSYRVTTNGTDWLVEEVDANHGGKRHVGRSGGQVDLVDEAPR